MVLPFVQKTWREKITNKNASPYIILLTLKHSPLNCRGASPFCLDTKRTKKIKSPERLLCRTGAFAAQSGKTAGAGIFLPIYPVAFLPCMQKVFVGLIVFLRHSRGLRRFLCPRPPHGPAVFPDFSRSFSADRKISSLQQVYG